MTAIKHATSPHEALKAAKQLVGAWPHARPPDPEGWAGSLAAVLAQYPLGVVQECCDPRSGLARGREFPPTVACVVEWCDRTLGAYRNVARRGPPEPQPVYSDEHRANMRLKLLGFFEQLKAGVFNKVQSESQQETAE